REGLRQVDLKRVGPPVIGDQPAADERGDEEDEHALPIEILLERLGANRQNLRRLRQIRSRVHLDDADEKRNPGEQQQREKAAPPEQSAHAGGPDGPPRAAALRADAVVASVAAVVNGHYVPPIAAANTSSSVCWHGRR